MSGELPKKVHNGEVLPALGPRHSDLPALPPGAPLGIPMLARAKYEGQTRAFRAYIALRLAQRDLIDTETEIVGAVQNRFAAEERLARSLKRQQHLDKILLADEAALLAELDSVFDTVVDTRTGHQEKKEEAALERRVRRANLEAEAIEAEARLERLRNPPPPPSPKVDPNAGLSRAQRAAREIARMKKDMAELRAALIEAAGGEGNLTDKDQDRLDTLELVLEDQVRSIIEDL